MNRIKFFVHFKRVEEREKKLAYSSCLDFLESLVSSFAMKNMVFKHIEIAFEPSKLTEQQRERLGVFFSNANQHISFTVFRQTGVTVRSREYTNKSYDCSLTCYANPQDVEKFVAFVEREKEEAKYGQSLLDIFLWPSRSNDGNYFCTKFVVCALQHLGYMKGMNPSEMLADNIYFALLQQDANSTGHGTPALRSNLVSIEGIRKI